MARMSITMDDKTVARLNKVINWGDKSMIFQFLAEDLCDLLESAEHRQAVLGAIALRKLKLRDISNTFEDKDGHKSD